MRLMMIRNIVKMTPWAGQLSWPAPSSGLDWRCSSHLRLELKLRVHAPELRGTSQG